MKQAAMTIGMLWYDADKKPLAEKIAEAAAYYQNKYRKTPNRCYVHPAESLPEKVGSIRIVPSKYIMPNHLWIGVEQ